MFFHIRYQSPLGGLTIAADEDGIAGIWFDRQKYFASGIDHLGSEEDSHPHLALCREWLDRYFAGSRPDADELVLSPRGTSVVQAVWQTLKRIPYGQTASCGDMRAATRELIKAEKLMTKQAFNSAMQRNPFAIVVPTHRVVGSSGNLKGYPAGVEKKIWLMRHEGIDPSCFYSPAGIGL